MSIVVAFLFILLATVVFLLAEVAVPRSLFQKISGLIDDLRRRPVPA
ncbi:MAG: hypothetical protein IID53_03280 [Proteobacteria bacterium]|nr:hypothetical protein [Pseudomonadota bacterium]